MKLEKWYNKALKSSEVGQLTLEMIETLVDNKIGDDVFSSFPVIGLVKGVRKGYNSITDHFYIKKALNVLLELGDVSIQERNNLIDDLDDEYSSGTEKILMSINHLNSYDKNGAFGRLCRLKAKEEISRDDFLRLTDILQKAFPEDLHSVMFFDPPRNEKLIDDGKYHALVGMGLLYSIPYDKNKHINRFGEFNQGPEIGLKYKLTESGLLVFKWYDYLFR